ncbi:unnamed protein product, partial [Pylaiella littoralis]
EKIDNAWFTACIIHNMLLQFDGLANLEKDMNWTGKDGEADETTGPFPAQTTVGSMDVGAGGDTKLPHAQGGTGGPLHIQEEEGVNCLVSERG